MSAESTVVVSNLSFNVVEGHVKEIFENFGKVSSVKIARNKFGHSLQWATVTFESQDMAENAIKRMNGGQIDGVEITVKQADPNVDVSL